MVFGSARVSTGEEQDTRMQETTLRAASVARTFRERTAGGRWDRPQLHRLLDHLRPNDVVVVWKLDRWARLLQDLLHLMDRIAHAGTGCRSRAEAAMSPGACGDGASPACSASAADGADQVCRGRIQVVEGPVTCTASKMIPGTPVAGSTRLCLCTCTPSSTDATLRSSERLGSDRESFHCLDRQHDL